MRIRHECPMHTRRTRYDIDLCMEWATTTVRKCTLLFTAPPIWWRNFGLGHLAKNFEKKLRNDAQYLHIIKTKDNNMYPGTRNTITHHPWNMHEFENNTVCLVRTRADENESKTTQPYTVRVKHVVNDDTRNISNQHPWNMRNTVLAHTRPVVKWIWNTTTPYGRVTWIKRGWIRTIL